MTCSTTTTTTTPTSTTSTTSTSTTPTLSSSWATSQPLTAEGEEDEDDETVDLEEELHPDDVEEPLDVLLLERTSSGLLDEEEYDDEDEDDTDERAEPGSRIPPKRPGEFVCRSCFLVKHPSQLADNDRVLCTDCV